MGPTFAAEDARSQVECGVQGHLATRRPPGWTYLLLQRQEQLGAQALRSDLREFDSFCTAYKLGKLFIT